MDVIKVVNLSKQYGLTKAVHELSFSVKKGEVYGFIGKNGAGKTTTINMLLSLTTKNQGQIFIYDKEVFYNDVDYKKFIGYVPDVPAFPGYMTARDFLRYTAEIFEMPNEVIESKIQEILTFVDLKNTKKRISTYSRGMKQRLAIAQGLLHDPEILIMDEPTSALDPIGRKDVMDIIKRLKGKKTIFYSTHILEDVEKVCDRIGLIDNGSLLFEDTIDSIKGTFYDNRYYLETEKNPKELATVLKGSALIKDGEYKDNGIVFTLVNGDSNELLKEVMSKGEVVVEFKQETLRLEEIFVRLTNENSN